MSVAARRASSRSSFVAYEPSPGGTPRARTSTTPPSVSRSALAASTAARISSSPSAPPTATARPATAIPISREQRLRDRAGRDDHRRVPRARALERVARVVVPVLHDAGEVGVAGPRQRDRLLALAGRLALGRPGAHPPRPVLVVAVADDERQRRPERPPVPQAGEHLDAVLLDLLARAAPVALLPPREVGVDRVAVELEPGGQPGHDRDERGPVRLAGGFQSEAHERESSAARMTSIGADSPVQRSNDAAPWRTSTSRPSTTVQPAARAAATSAVGSPSSR